MALFLLLLVLFGVVIFYLLVGTSFLVVLVASPFIWLWNMKWVILKILFVIIIMLLFLYFYFKKQLFERD